VLLLVVAVSAEADYLHVVPQTHTVLTKQVPTIFKQVQHVPTLYQTVQKPLEDVHTPIVYQTVQKPVEALQTPIVKTLETIDIINPFKIQAVQTPLVIPTLYQHVPTIYQTLQTPTIFKIDEDKLVKVDDDEEDEDEDKEGEVLPLIKHITHKRIVRSADNEDYYISNADNTQFYKVKLDDVDEDEEEEEVVVPYLIHQIPNIHHTPIKTLETAHILKPVEKLEKFDDEHILVRKARSADNIEVKKTDSHFLNVLTNKPTNTPVATTYIHNTMPVEADSVHIVAPRVSVPTNIPVVSTGIKAVKPVHTPISKEGTTLIHNAKTGVEVAAPRVLVNPVQTPLIKAFNPVQTPLVKTFNTVQTPLIKAFNPVQTPLIKTFNTVQTPLINTPVVRTLTHTPIVQTPAFKTLETTDIVNPVQKTVQIQTPTLYTTINKPVVTPLVTPVQLVNQPIFKTVQTPVVRTVVQTPVEITPGYIAATHGNIHTAPLPEGPSNDGLFASHHINLPNVKA
jgi:hypothetical protein